MTLFSGGLGPLFYLLFLFGLREDLSVAIRAEGFRESAFWD